MAVDKKVRSLSGTAGDAKAMLSRVDDGNDLETCESRELYGYVG
jgi:hypothetical protein